MGYILVASAILFLVTVIGIIISEWYSKRAKRKSYIEWRIEQIIWKDIEDRQTQESNPEPLTLEQLNDRLCCYDSTNDYLTFAEYSYIVANLDWFDLEDHILFLESAALSGKGWAAGPQFSRLIAIATEERESRV